MNLKKFLKTGQVLLEIPKNSLQKHKFLKGQAALEYFILLAVIGALTLISVSSFLPQVKQASQNLYQAAVSRIVNH